MTALRVTLLALQFALIPAMIDAGLARYWATMFILGGISITAAYINLAIGAAKNWRETRAY